MDHGFAGGASRQTGKPITQGVRTTFSEMMKATLRLRLSLPDALRNLIIHRTGHILFGLVDLAGTKLWILSADPPSIVPE